jgi:hypothetical protein
MMAKAVYSALQDQKIRYIIPEAGFEKGAENQAGGFHLPVSDGKLP